MQAALAEQRETAEAMRHQHQELVALKARQGELSRQVMERGFVVQRALAHERQVFDREFMNGNEQAKTIGMLANNMVRGNV